jgi:RND family efflux transporter MFP subunit
MNSLLTFIKRRLRFILPLAIVAVALLMAMIMIRSRPKVQIAPREVPPPLVRVQTVERQDHQYTVYTQGTVAPRTEIMIVAEVSGRILRASSSLAAGGFFERGETLALVDPRDYELAVERARSAQKQAELRVAREEAEAEVARREWLRLGDGDASPLALREPQLAEARAALAAAEAALEQAKRDLDRAYIRAPFDCLVRQKSVDVGQFVTRGTPVAQVYAVDYAEVRLPVTDDELAALEVPMEYKGGRAMPEGAGVELRATFAGAEHAWKGRIVRTEGIIDPQSRMLYLVARVEDPYSQSDNPGRPPLTVGLFVDAEIQGRMVTDVFVIPRAALRGWDQVLVVDDESRLHIRNVEILRTEGEFAVVGSGLEDGVKVCMTHLETVVDGMEVRIESIESPKLKIAAEEGSA